MSRSRSAQVHVIVVVSPEGRTWVVGTGSQKGFTEAAAGRTTELLKERGSRGWKFMPMEIVPVDEALPAAPPVPAP